jgi:hypothetical protein
MSSSFEGPPGRLTGWKEIAAYLGKGARSAQRWEKLYGLPVHRVGREGGEIVFAFRDEIERWAARASRERAAGGEVTALPEGDALRAGPARRWLAKAFGLFTLLAAAAGALVLLRPPAPGSTGRVRTGTPSGWRLENQRLVVFDGSGEVLFDHDFAYGLHRRDSSSEADAAEARVLIADVEGDGDLEVLVGSPALRRENRQLYCFEADGRLRFAHQPTGHVRFGDREYGEPWLAHRMFVTEGPGGARSLWAIFTHSLWFPTRLQELDPRGTVRREYWSDGYVDYVAEATWRGHQILLVGGTNNDLEGASLAIFDRDAVGGRAPASRAEYKCSSCPEGGPQELVVFPTLCMARKEGAATLVEAWVEGDDRLMVIVNQGERDAVVYYTLDRDLVPVHAEISPTFQQAHVLLERQGLLDHPFGPRDVAAMFPVQRWDGTRFVDLPRVKVTR